MDRKEWNTTQLQEDFTVHSFLAPFVYVTRKSDGVKGMLEFTHSPRVYFDFISEQKSYSGQIVSGTMDAIKKGRV